MPLFLYQSFVKGLIGFGIGLLKRKEDFDFLIRDESEANKTSHQTNGNAMQWRQWTECLFSVGGWIVDDDAPAAVPAFFPLLPFKARACIHKIRKRMMKEERKPSSAIEKGSKQSPSLLLSNFSFFLSISPSLSHSFYSLTYRFDSQLSV